jgi:hypothetical protein
MMTSTDKSLVLEMEQILLKKYHKVRTSVEKAVSYLGCTWDFHEKGIVKVSQTGTIQDLVASREKFHKDRGTHSLSVGESSIDRDRYSRWHRASESEWIIPGGLQERYDPVQLSVIFDSWGLYAST